MVARKPWTRHLAKRRSEAKTKSLLEKPSGLSGPLAYWLVWLRHRVSLRIAERTGDQGAGSSVAAKERKPRAA